MGGKDAADKLSPDAVVERPPQTEYNPCPINYIDGEVCWVILLLKVICVNQAPRNRGQKLE
jgi:hypothetical protein